MPGTKWITGDVITFNRMNQKTLIVQAAEPAIMYPGMLWFDTDNDNLYERNAANAAWIDRSDHGALDGLGDDDHAQYLNNARHDLTARHSFLAGLDAAGKLVLSQIGTKVADLATLWTKGTKIVFGDITGLPGTIASILTDHNKANHDALGITPGPHILNTSGPHTGPLQDSDVAGHAVGEVLAEFTCPLSGPFATSAGAAAVVDYTDFILNISDFPADAKAILRIVWMNSGNNTNNMDLYDQFGAAPVAGSSESEGMVAGVWEISETDAPFTLPAGLKSFQLRLWTSGGTLTVASAVLQIERAA